MRAIGRKKFFLIAAVALCHATAVRAQEASKDSKFLAEFPELNTFTYKEPESQFYFGFGATPLMFVKSKLSFGLSAFQLHHMTKRLDWELVNGSVLMVLGGAAQAKSQHFVVRSVPKYRFNKMLSIGPLIGYEVLAFPDVKSSLTSGGRTTPYEPFSSRGVIYGAAVSQVFELGNDRFVRLSQIFYKQTYKYLKSADGWTYNFTNPDTGITTKPETIEPGYVFGFEAAYMF